MFAPAVQVARRRVWRSQIVLGRRLASKQVKTNKPVTYNATSKPDNAPSLIPFLERHPTLMRAFKKFAQFVFKQSPKTLAGVSGVRIYESISDLHVKHYQFFYEECALPATFQTWFRITNLHAWLLVVRFRALQKEHGRLFIQALVTNFFEDTEIRMRDALTFVPEGKTKPVAPPERVVKKYMNIYREQWNGLHFALDVALASPTNADAELAATVWRNFLSGRGARGIDGLEPLGEEDLPELETGKGSIKPTADADPNVSLERYVEFPRLMFALSRYIRAETIRLADIPDHEIISGNLGEWRAIDPTVNISRELPP
ncbi:hypothetical protein EXIGLDRAFT_696951 [Exidia glandulosa HHB12029]|uniref:Ubiquinol-cytochrome c chaperone domain-containing protein n=1 Tax=Exidia glandulosa HHB12029 TaxID=1314781 RepID=A0A165F0U8_EXIGL|nr:hypothetical protein EXIGLDRAFT_696951 [Exidia glandulosa HHB12029]